MTPIFLAAAALIAAAPAFATTAVTPTMAEVWLKPFAVSPSNPNSYGELTDDNFKIDGNYCVPYGGAKPVCLENANVSFGASKNPAHGTMTLTVPAGQYAGGEVATGAGWLPAGSTPPFGPSPYGYGYYETRMQPSCVQGEISSFFWIEAPKYGPHEWDVEFPNPPGHTFTDVHWTIHPSGKTVDFQLGFNPCEATHRYGFLWVPGSITFTVDGQSKYTFTDPTLTTTATGFVMMNAWDGNPNWGGGPPAADAVNYYEWVRFYNAAATIMP